jgi:IS4 transposase
MRWKRIVWNVKRLPGDYRSRWGIEKGYVGVEGFRARTTSRNHLLRLLYFFYSLILYNVWLLANLMLARRFSKVFGEPIITIQMVKAVMKSMIIESLRKG